MLVGEDELPKRDCFLSRKEVKKKGCLSFSVSFFGKACALLFLFCRSAEDPSVCKYMFFCV